MTQAALHPLVQEYLTRLAFESRALRPDQANELMADITEHIHSGLGEDATEVDVRNLLDRLGTPAEVVAAATPAGASPAPPTGSKQPGALEIGAVVALFVAELTAPVLIGFAFWILGLVLMTISGVWSGREKLRGFLSLGTGAPVVFGLLTLGLVSMVSVAQVCRTEPITTPVPATPSTEPSVAETAVRETCSGTTLSPWLLVLLGLLVLAYFVYQVLTARALLRTRAVTVS